MQPIAQTSELQALATSAAQTASCRCNLSRSKGWTSMAEERWPGDQMQQVPTLRDPDLLEPTFEEWHPEGTRYDDPNAPVAIAYFPYNRCAVWQCRSCQGSVLRYTEFGGYYVDHRVRLLDTDLIVDAPVPAP